MKKDKATEGLQVQRTKEEIERIEYLLSEAKKAYEKENNAYLSYLKAIESEFGIDMRSEIEQLKQNEGQKK
jgi:hypothetical protein